MEKEKNTILILHDIRSAQNVGAIFRTGDAIGISKIIISGHTPAPIDRFGREQTKINKASLGAEKSVEWEQVEDILDFLKNKKEEGFCVIALEQSTDSVDYKKVEATEKNIVVLGNEVEGVSSEILDLADVVAEIPMKGEKESLNVSVATGVFLYRLLDTD